MLLHIHRPSPKQSEQREGHDRHGEKDVTDQDEEIDLGEFALVGLRPRVEPMVDHVAGEEEHRRAEGQEHRVAMPLDSTLSNEDERHDQQDRRHAIQGRIDHRQNRDVQRGLHAVRTRSQDEKSDRAGDENRHDVDDAQPEALSLIWMIHLSLMPSLQGPCKPCAPSI